MAINTKHRGAFQEILKLNLCIFILFLGKKLLPGIDLGTYDVSLRKVHNQWLTMYKKSSALFEVLSVHGVFLF